MRLAVLLLLLHGPAPAAAAQVLWPPLPAAQPLPTPAWNPAADYVTAGQDEPGYRRWYGEASYRPTFVATFNRYLEREGVAGIFPTWQLLRTATDWQRCGAQPFEVPPPELWANLVATLRFVHGHVVPAIGQVEPVSVYRGPALNLCAGGAQESSHLHLGAVDLVPLRPTDRATLIGKLCAAHRIAGEGSRAGLGFYRGLRFHIDSARFRNWGADGEGAFACDPATRPLDPLAPAAAASAVTGSPPGSPP